MTNSYDLSILTELREKSAVSQKEMADACGLSGRQSRKTVGNWERGEVKPRSNRRYKFIGYLWDTLGLRDDKELFENVWSTLADEWEWEPISDQEWTRLFPGVKRVPLPDQNRLDKLERMMYQVQNGLNTSQVELRTNHSRFNIYLCEAIEDVVELPAKLFGREDLLPEIEQRLEKSGRVLIHGLAGAGKTAVAASIVADRLSSSTAPILWLEIGDLHADLVIDRLIQLYGTDAEREAYGIGNEATLNRIIREILVRLEISSLVIDNVWNGQTLHRLTRIVPPEISILATSRQTVPRFERFELSDLLPLDAINLLAHYSGQQIDEDDADAQGLCADLGYHAYALEIAGSMLDTHPHMTPSDMREMIANAPHDVAMPGGFATEGRENLKTLLDQSYEALSTEEQQVLQILGNLFTPNVTSAFLASCLELSPNEVEKRANGLIARSLLKSRKSGYYSLHDLTFSYARSLCKEGESNSSLDGKAVHDYLNTNNADFDILAFDLQNILGTAELAYNEDSDSFLDIIYSISICGFLDARGYTAQILAALDLAIAKLPQDGDHDEELHHLLTKRGNAYVTHGEFDKALSAYKAAVAVSPNPNRRAILTALIGKVHAFQSQYTDADKYFREARDISEEHDDKNALCFLLGQQSHAASLREDFGQVRDLSIEGIELALHINDQPRESYFRMNLGSAEFHLGIQNAFKQYQHSLSLAMSMGDNALRARTLHALGINHHALEEFSKAQEYLQNAYIFYDSVDAIQYKNEIKNLMSQFGYK